MDVTASHDASSDIVGVNQRAVSDGATSSKGEVGLPPSGQQLPPRGTDVVKQTKTKTDQSPPDTSHHQQERILHTVLEGSCTFDILPPQSKNIVRIFVSSTFSDTKEERNAFMQRVYPKLGELCRQKYGLEFQVVDMRWGVPEQASENHSTTELCLNEIQKCQEVSAGPNFVAILGNKYGYRPIPNEIEESEFEVLASLEQTKSDSRWKVVCNWYRLDTNCLPPVYILQPIGDILPDYNNTEDKELRKKAMNEWNHIDQTLTKCLRDIAGIAFDSKKLTEDQKHKYFMSVTENEVKHGILENKEVSHSCLCIVREIPNITEYISENKAPKFIDIDTNANAVDGEAEKYLKTLKNQKIMETVPAKNMTAIDIDWEASGAKVSLENVAKEVSVSDSFTRHEQYLDKLCSEYLSKLENLIVSAGDKQNKLYDETMNEVLQHWYFAKERCQVFEGRENIIHEAKRYISIKTNHPLIIYGNSGCGKTSVISKLVQQISKAISMKGSSSKKPLRFCFRFLGTTPLTSNIQQVLVSLCKQLSLSCDMKWEEPDKYPDLVRSFHNLLQLISKKYRLLLVLDSIDQLLPAYNAFKLGWLPKELHRNVKIILSTLDEGYPILDTLKEMYSSTNTTFIEVAPLPKDVGMQIIKAWLHRGKRTVSSAQDTLIQQALDICGLPLFARIMFDQVRKWKSYESYTLNDLETSVQGAINKLYDQMETKFGFILVKHSLSYLTSSRYGLSEVELEHIMSLDDDLLNEVFRYWKPPIRRIPALLWTRIRNEIDSYIVERSADGVLVLYWYHRQFITATRQRYLKDIDFLKYIHTVMCEYFDGTWGGGKCKPFTYDKFQSKRFGFSSPEAREDRKVPLQPYIIDDIGSKSQRRFNNRKVTELPHHLFKVGDMDGLKDKVFFNLDWIYAKMKGSSTQALIQEVELFMDSHSSIKTEMVYKILFATLQLIRPYIMKYPESLPYELSGRLTKYMDRFPVFRSLIKACDKRGTAYCPLTPIYSCFESAQIGLKQNLTTSQSEPIHDGGCICCTSDFQTMYSITFNETGLPFLSTWDIDMGSRTQRVIIEKTNRTMEAFDSYFQCLLHRTEKFIIALYRKKFFRYDGPGKQRYTKFGYVDVIDIKAGAVIRTFEHDLYGRDFHNCVNFMKGDYLAVWFGVKVPLLHLFENVRHRHSRPHMITHDCTMSINKCSQRTAVRYYAGDQKSVGHTRTKSVQVKHLGWTKDDKETLGELEDSAQTYGIGVSHSDKVVILGRFTGELSIYKLRHLGNKKSIKSRSKLLLPRNDHVKTQTVSDNRDSDSDSDSDADEPKPGKKAPFNLRMTIIVSPDDRYIISIHQNPMVWEAFLWSLQKRDFIARIADGLPLHYKYPQFTSDGNFIVMASERQVQILSSVDGKTVNTYDVNADIRDWCVSQAENQAAIMLGREIIFVEVGDKSNVADNTKQATQIDKVCLIQREKYSSISTLVSNYAVTSSKGLHIEERPDPAEQLTRGLLTSGHNGERVALDVLYTPDGNGVVELFSRVQIVDTKEEMIKYTPLKGDLYFPLPNNDDDDKQTTGPHQIYDSSSLVLPCTMKTGDKIVGGNGRVRLRVNETDGNLHIMRLASFVTFKSICDGKVKQDFGISVYDETIKVLSKNFLLMLKKTKEDVENIAVYDTVKGKCLNKIPVSGRISLLTVLPDETRMAVVTKDLKIHIYSGQNFNRGQGRIILKENEKEDKRDVKDMMTFPLAPDVILLRFTVDSGSNTHGYQYQRINLVTRNVSPVILAKLPFEDISSDAMLAIDSQLIIHDLEKGSIHQRISYAKQSVNMRVRAAISPNHIYVAFVDKTDDTLHVYKSSGKKYQPLVSCKAHVPQLPPYGGFSFRDQGRVISMKSGQNVVLVAIRDDQSQETRKLVHTNELQRAITLTSKVAEMKQTLSESTVNETKKAILPATQPSTSTTKNPEANHNDKMNIMVDEKNQESGQNGVIVEDFLSYLASAADQQASETSQ